ncbi:MAG: EVE domain-containing protein [Flammeovirgaceae bacterium]|jgi:predicted RNA-binding protein with PUA-like domain|nr:EVE domain-containing protein [Flammeovirgaceae bacterium]
MNYWLLKTEPSTFSWDDLVKDKKAVWDGVRNFQARNNLKAMKKGDFAFIYHSMDDKAVIGIAEITREHYPDPKDQDWVAIDIKPVKKLKSPVTLTTVKKDKRLSNMVLVKNSRLSVQPVKSEEFDLVIGLSE